MTNLWTALILVVGMLMAAAIFGGRYTAVGSRDRIVYVVDRFTGSVKFCVLDDCRMSKLPMDFSSQAVPAKKGSP
jgi:hypothetical protein